MDRTIKPWDQTASLETRFRIKQATQTLKIMTISRREVITAAALSSLVTRAQGKVATTEELRTFSSLEVARIASAKLPLGSHILVEGKGVYLITPINTSDLSSIPRGATGLKVLPVMGVYFAASFGDTCNAETAQIALTSACRSVSCKSVLFTGNWSIDTTVTIDDPDNIYVSAWGATFVTKEDILAFDFNGRADPLYIDNESRQNFRWHGGRFLFSGVSETTAAAVRMLGFRSAEFYPEMFRGWHTDIISGGKDTVRIGGYKTYDCAISIEYPPWSTIGGPLMVAISNVHASLATKRGKAILSYVPLSDSEVRNISCNLGENADVDGAIDIRRSILLAVKSIDFKLRKGETIIGELSKAHAKLEEIYVHKWPFKIDQPMIYLVASKPSGQLFVPGEVVRGLETGAKAVLTTAGHTQVVEWQNFMISGANHFEAGKIAKGAICVRLRDQIRRGPAALHFSLQLGSVGVNGGGAVGLELEHIKGVEVSARFSQTAGNGIPLKLDRGCANIFLSQNTFLSTGAIDYGGMPKHQLKLPQQPF